MVTWEFCCRSTMWVDDCLGGNCFCISETACWDNWELCCGVCICCNVTWDNCEDDCCWEECNCCMIGVAASWFPQFEKTCGCELLKMCCGWYETLGSIWPPAELPRLGGGLKVNQGNRKANLMFGNIPLLKATRKMGTQNVPNWF